MKRKEELHFGDGNLLVASPILKCLSEIWETARG